ncbi:MAG: hypothetical protein IKS96_11990 [Fibrobacter sp.]|nr:hypothetical protein [Fibrobacter sp.]
MKNIKIMMAVALAVMVTSSFAARAVKSKLGDIELTNQKDGGSVVCTAGFNDELTILRDAETSVLVKGKCGQGWVDKSKIEYVAEGPGDKSIKLGDVILVGWDDNRTLMEVFSDHIEDFEGVDINRDFKEYLTYTMDREQTEMRNGEN